MTAADAKPGDTVATTGGTTTIKTTWATKVRGKDRIGIALDNGLVYTNLRPTDQIGAPE